MKARYNWSKTIRVDITLDLPAEMVDESEEDVHHTVQFLLMASTMLNRVLIDEYGEEWLDDVMRMTVDALSAGRLFE